MKLAAPLLPLREDGGGEAARTGFSIASRQQMHKDLRREDGLMRQFDPIARQRIRGAASYSGDRSLVVQMGQGFPFNEDWKPRAEYYLGLARYPQLR